MLGCAGLGISSVNPDTFTKMPRRLEKLSSGWFYTGPYGGHTRRLYRDGKKDIRFILDGEESAPIRWRAGDRISILARPRDTTTKEWEWSITLFINRRIVMACSMPMEKNEDPHNPKIYAYAEAYGYVTGLRLCQEAAPTGLDIPFKPNDKELMAMKDRYAASVKKAEDDKASEAGEEDDVQSVKSLQSTTKSVPAMSVPATPLKVGHSDSQSQRLSSKRLGHRTRKTNECAMTSLINRTSEKSEASNEATSEKKEE